MASDIQYAPAALLLSEIVQSSDDAILSQDLDGRVTSWNDGAVRMFGYSVDEMVGQPITTLIPKERWEEECRAFEHVKSGERVAVYETIRRKKDGTLIPVAVRLSPVRDPAGRIVGVSRIARDVTERKSAEATALLLSSIVDFSDDAIISKNLDGVITSWNRAAERIFGYTASEAIGQPITILIPPDRLTEEGDILARLRRGERVDHFETVRQRKDGQPVMVSVTISPLKDARGNVIGASKIARDITERKRMEAALVQANRDLEQFAYSAAHDLQEPLRRLSLLAGLLVNRAAERLGAKEREMTMMIQTTATRMSMLVSGLLSFAQSLAVEVPASAIDANDALDGALANLARAIEQSGATVTRCALPRIRIHPTQLQQLFQNLVGNAIKYRAGDVPPVVSVSAQRNGLEWEFCVCDNGIGIAPEDRTKIFGAFKRLHAASQYPGSGLGLALCQRIVERMQGRIWVESEPGKGSKFKFTLPAI